MSDEEKKISFLPQSIVVILGSTYFLVILCVLLVIPILQLAIGSVYRDQCPVEPYIPVYLIVSGACGLASILLTIAIVVAFIFVIQSNSSKAPFVAACVLGLILAFLILMSLFLFAWFIAGNVWIFGAYKKVDMETSSTPNYCHRTLYQFAFAMLIVTYALSVLSCCCSCVRSCFQVKAALSGGSK